MHLIGVGFDSLLNAGEWLLVPLNWLTILKVCFGLGLVIFVHELGHFAVAKWCGVRCDKFYIGFDVPIKIGWGKWGFRLPKTLWKKQWGETEYGIGILPLGGYVKMLGQDDNPQQTANEIRKTRVPVSKVDNKSKEKSAAAKEESTKETPVVADNKTNVDRRSVSRDEDDSKASDSKTEEFVLDPRSYQAKSVPQRMAIISAGVIMNVIFAFVFAATAFSLGLQYIPGGSSHVVPGLAAWREGGLSGDVYVKIKDKVDPTFKDIVNAVNYDDLKNSEDGIPITVERTIETFDADGNLKSEVITVAISPKTDIDLTLQRIGVMSLKTNRLSRILPFWSKSAADIDTEDEGKKFNKLDTVIKIEPKEPDRLPQSVRDRMRGFTIRDENYTDILRALTFYADQDIRVTVLRDEEEITIEVPRHAMRRLGLQMKIGKITAVQKNSPAADAEPIDDDSSIGKGIKAGDFFEQIQIGGKVVPVNFDPILLPAMIKRAVMQNPKVEINIRVTREAEEGASKHITFRISPRLATWYEYPSSPKVPVSSPELGIAFKTLNSVQIVTPESPAEKAGLRSGDEIISATIVPADDDGRKEELKRGGELGLNKPIEFGADNPNWPYFVNRLQRILPESKVKLTVRRGDQELEMELQPVASPDAYYAVRGFNFEPLFRIDKAESFGEAISKGFDKTLESLAMVFTFMKDLKNNPKKGKMMGGPITIARYAGNQAQQSIPALLIFLTMISANLAIINFLPIPVLDGGHFVFLAIEGVTGKPVDERVMAAFQYIGLALLLTLMIFVFGLDLGLISRE